MDYLRTELDEQTYAVHVGFCTFPLAVQRTMRGNSPEGVVSCHVVLAGWLVDSSSHF